jgi:hypothetical protein
MTTYTIDLGKYGRSREEIHAEMTKFENRITYINFLINKAINHTKISELFEAWQVMRVIEYVSSKSCH